MVKKHFLSFLKIIFFVFSGLLKSDEGKQVYKAEAKKLIKQVRQELDSDENSKNKKNKALLVMTKAIAKLDQDLEVFEEKIEKRQKWLIFLLVLVLLALIIQIVFLFLV